MQHDTLDPDGLSLQKEAIHFRPDINTDKRYHDRKTHLSIDHKFTLPSPAPLTRFTRLGLWDNVACGCQATPPTRSLCPRNERIGVQAGTFHNFTVPDQLPVASISLLGANRTCDIGRSSPICEPRLAIFWSSPTSERKSGKKNEWTYLDVWENFFADVDYTT